MNNASNLSLTGDGRRVRVASNSGCLLVVGNRTDVVVERNDGQVRVVGNQSRVVVARNRGVVQYVGNAGCVRAGGGSVDYAGCDGHVERDLSAEAASRPCSCAAAAAAADSARTAPAPQQPPPPPGAPPCGEPMVLVAHRPDAHSQFRRIHLRANTPATTININVSSAAECNKWRSRFTKGFWIAT